MNRMFKFFVAAAAMAVWTTSSFADLTGSATAHVRVNVSPNVAIQAVNLTIDAGSVQTGDFTATIDYRVDANKQEVSLWSAVSPLFKGNDPTNLDVVPIPINLSAGVNMQPANGNATGGHSNTAVYLGAGPTVDGFPTMLTETVEYSSSQNNHFSQNVRVIVTWTQDDDERPTGEYSGVVQLTALLLPA